MNTSHLSKERQSNSEATGKCVWGGQGKDNGNKKVSWLKKKKLSSYSLCS